MIPRAPDDVRKLVSARRWKRKHLDGLRQQFGEEALFEALFSAFTHSPPLPMHEQEAPGTYLLEFTPRGRGELQALIHKSLRGWNLSIEQLPFYFREAYGIESVRSALDKIEMETSLAEVEHRALQTYRYWLRLLPAAEPDAEPNRSS
jgi:hypothetical protein